MMKYDRRVRIIGCGNWRQHHEEIKDKMLEGVLKLHSLPGVYYKVT